MLLVPLSRSSWIEFLLFPRNRVVQFAVIAFVSVGFSLLLTGTQIGHANWGLIDDHETFGLLSVGVDRSPIEIWNALLASAGAGQLPVHNRPVYYFLKVVQTWLFGQDVHLWYLRNTLCFALLLCSIWWIISRFVGAWLGGALTAYLALLPMWSGVWSRLGPSEIDGAACAAVMIFAADMLLFSERRWARNVAAIVFTLAAIALAGMKETFLPLSAGGLIFVLPLAVWRKQLSTKLATVLAIFGMTSIGAMSYVIWTNLRGTGIDYYGNSISPGYTLGFAALGLVDALVRTWWVWILPIALLQLLKLVSPKPLSAWITNSIAAAATYVFVIAMYAAQCGVYRMIFPTNSRYDFPAMLLVPIVSIILACEIFNKLREHYPSKTIDYMQFLVATLIAFALATTTVRKTPELTAAIKVNVATTNSYFTELQRLVSDANKFPDRPIILEAYGSRSYEAVYSVRTYLIALHTQNPIAVRFHPGSTAATSFLSGLDLALADLEAGKVDKFTSLSKALSDPRIGCLSVGLYGPADSASCTGFRMGDSDPT